MADYDPENTIRELRHAIATRDDGFQTIWRIMREAAGRAERDLWPDPATRETAGMGALVAGASIAAVTDPQWAVMANSVSLFGLALIDSAREEMRRG